MSGVKKKTGRQPGSLGEGSLTARLLALKVSDCAMLPDVGTNPHTNYTITIKRAKAQAPTGEWKLETCTGFAANLETVPFRFYRITRIK